MNTRVASCVAFVISVGITTTQLAGCQECRESESPCAGEASFLMCTDRDASHLRWVDSDCPGIEPICVDLPDNQHRCEDRASPLRCAEARLLPIPALDNLDGVLDVADLDGNGRPDLLLFERDQEGTSLMRVMQRSDGGFEAPIEILASTASEPWISAADLDGDTRIDLLERGGLGREIAARLGRADGSFSEPVTGISLAGWIFELSDIDGDGGADLIALDEDMLVVLGPPPEFAPFVALQVPLPLPQRDGEQPRIADAMARDLDGDGRPELIAYTTADEVHWWNHVFTRVDNEWVPDSRAWDLENTFFQHVADFDHDGVPDRISIVDQGAVRPRVFVATGDGAGKFSKHDARQLPEHGRIASGDFDRDGNRDLVSAGSVGLSVLRGRGDGALEPAETFALPQDFVCTGIVADIDVDGSLDLLGWELVGRQIFLLPRACLK